LLGLLLAGEIELNDERPLPAGYAFRHPAAHRWAAP